MQWNTTHPLEENEIMPFAATRMDPEMITLSEVSQAEKGKHRMTSRLHGIWNTPKGTRLWNRLTATESRPEAGFLSPTFQMKTWSASPPLYAVPSSPSPLSSPPSQHQCHPLACAKSKEAHAHCWPEYAACQPALCLSTRPHTVKAVPGWTPGLRTLQNALFLGGCSLGTKHHCGQAAGGRGAPPEESKRAKALLLVVPPQVNQSASLHQMGSY